MRLLQAVASFDKWGQILWLLAASCWLLVAASSKQVGGAATMSHT